MFTIDTYRLATSHSYRRNLLGTRVRYVTASGTEVVGTLAEHPMHPGGLQLAVTTDAGKWAAVYAGETLARVA